MRLRQLYQTPLYETFYFNLSLLSIASLHLESDLFVVCLMLLISVFLKLYEVVQ